MLDVSGLKKHFPAGGAIGGWRAKGWVKAVDGVDLTIGKGETLGLVGVRLRQDHHHEDSALAGEADRRLDPLRR